MSVRELLGKICVVTGASRGIGKGIALQLGEKGAKVYITGRTLDSGKLSPNLGSLRQTETEIRDRGGMCEPVKCDHLNDEDVRKLFERVERENDGRLDILVNNAWGAVDSTFDNFGLRFWEMPISTWDDNNMSGLRNNYMCTVYAAKMMVKRKNGMIVNVTSNGGLHSSFSFNVPYGVGKEGCDRMTADCGRELKDSNVAVISLWPSPVETEYVVKLLKEERCEGPTTEIGGRRNKGREMIKGFSWYETTEFSGKCVVALANDKHIMKKTGKIYTTFDIGREYGLKDKEGHGPTDLRSVTHLLQMGGYTRSAALTPIFIRVPKWVMSLAGNKFG